MYCSDEREITLNIIPLSFKMLYMLIKTISRLLYICAVDFSPLSSEFIIAALVWIAIHFLILVVCVDMAVMR